ncbi:IPExxxVDY family protein [Maribacter sp. TH_r10]|uniref:IPExxxVDY family protein n=1 Tax=Maribacter luteus TaxID=2594478 RepID=A0A6I2MH78_9FLAO|nr:MULTISPECIES: IPExxxVDY family protein [Maribacter]MDV7137780.1 IPExxxVDY family protein [Maribacter sp. TH_r10]MRX63058.1 IPExxxVDY family protein [Maribacter luteus]|tara:strand:+ start:4693 stop:5157 length:465 start_codon:yes stop_codon:yes gene_type:complete
MAAVHKISGDFYEEDFTLIALHSTMQDYAVVYALNNVLMSLFVRAPKDLEVSEHMSFPFFEWQDDQHDRYWIVIANKSTKKELLVRDGLFQDEPSFAKHYLVPEHKEVDYFVKIEHDDDLNTSDLVKKLLTIPKIITAYSLDADTLKSRNNLIF